MAKTSLGTSQDWLFELSGSERRGLLEKGSCQKVHFLEILENLEILEILENLQTVENKGEADHFLEILENLEILEILESRPVKRPLFQKTPFSCPETYFKSGVF